MCGSAETFLANIYSGECVAFAGEYRFWILSHSEWPYPHFFRTEIADRAPGKAGISHLCCQEKTKQTNTARD